MREVNQYFDKKDGMFHITFFTKIKSVSIINSLNYRIYSVNLSDGRVIKDPNFLDSKYVFNIPSKMLNKEVFFNFSFSPNDIELVDSFKFGLCDEKVRWYTDQFVEINNNITKLSPTKDVPKEKEEVILISKNEIKDIIIESNNFNSPKLDAKNDIDKVTVEELVDFIEPNISTSTMETVEIKNISDISKESRSLEVSDVTRSNKKNWKNKVKSK